jgi:hypothetical protein
MVLKMHTACVRPSTRFPIHDADTPHAETHLARNPRLKIQRNSARWLWGRYKVTTKPQPLSYTTYTALMTTSQIVIHDDALPRRLIHHESQESKSRVKESSERRKIF